MKRIPLIGSFILFIALCASAAYWALHYLQPAPRAIIAPPPTTVVAPELSAAATLLGGGRGTAASNFQLTGIIVSDHTNESIAIIAIDGKPAKPIHIHAEISPGVSVREIQRGFVMLSDHGTNKRLELPANTKTAPSTNLLSPTPVVNAAPQLIPVTPLPPAPLPNAPPPPATYPSGIFNQANRHTGSFLPR